MDTLAEIQERHDAVREVERKLLDLQQVYFSIPLDLFFIYSPFLQYNIYFLKTWPAYKSH